MRDNINPKPLYHRSLISLVPALLLGSAVFWIPMLLFLGLANEILDNRSLPGDVAILQVLRSFSTPVLDSFAVFVTNLGGAPVVYAGITIAGAILYLGGHRRDALFLLFSAAGTVLINIVFKLFFQRTRPDLLDQIVIENGFSFPSGHAMISSAIALSVILICWHGRYRVAAIIGGVLYTLFVGLSRLYLGVHYPSDIIAGWCVSMLWVATIYYIFGRSGSAPPTQSKLTTTDSSIGEINNSPLSK